MGKGMLSTGITNLIILSCGQHDSNLLKMHIKVYLLNLLQNKPSFPRLKNPKNTLLKHSFKKNGTFWTPEILDLEFLFVQHNPLFLFIYILITWQYKKQQIFSLMLLFRPKHSFQRVIWFLATASVALFYSSCSDCDM